MDALFGRFQHFWDLLGVPGKVLLSLYALLGALTFVRDNMLPPATRDRWDTFNLLPEWTLSKWLAIGLMLLLLGVVETSFRMHRKLQQANIALQSQLDATLDLRVELLENTEVSTDDGMSLEIWMDLRISNPADHRVTLKFEIALWGQVVYQQWFDEAQGSIPWKKLTILEAREGKQGKMHITLNPIPDMPPRTVMTLVIQDIATGRKHEEVVWTVPP